MSNSVTTSLDWASYREGQSVITFVDQPTPFDASKLPVLIVGQLPHIKALPWQYVSTKFGIVTESMWKSGIDKLSPMDSISLHLNNAYVAALPTKCSRHNSPSQARALSKIVRSFVSYNAPEQAVVVACPYEYVLSSACAIARSLPLFSAKSSSHWQQQQQGGGGGEQPAAGSQRAPQRVYVEFIVCGGVSDGSGAAAGDGVQQPLTHADIHCVNTVSAGVRLAAQIVDMPCNLMNTDHFIMKIEMIARELGIEPHIVRGKQLEAAGFGGIYGVGKAAAHPPALVSLSHIPTEQQQQAHSEHTQPVSIALVGKGIVYDTGGLCIKTKTGMPGMKRDCGGAAAILGAFYAAVKSGFSAKLHAVFCLAENAVGPDATRPDDIHRLYSGKSVEINNTDAEGRLVLADGVVYAQRDLGASMIVDVATLTGAQGIATGRYHGALLTNNQQWESMSVAAGLACGDMVHPVPYCPELHFPEFTSAVADMKNSVADRSNAQPSCAGLFIGAHLGFDYPGVWIHIDMAAPVHCGERATGYGVALLVTLFGMWSTQKMLRYIAPTNTDSDHNTNDSNILDNNVSCNPSKKLRTQ